MLAGLSLLHLEWLVSHTSRFRGIPAKCIVLSMGGSFQEKTVQRVTGPVCLSLSPKDLVLPKTSVISTCASHSSELPPSPLAQFPTVCCSPCLWLWQLWASCADRGGKPVCFQAGEGELGLGWSCSAVLVSSCQQCPGRGLVFTGYPLWLLLGCCCALQGQWFPMCCALTTCVSQISSEVVGCSAKYRTP